MLAPELLQRLPETISRFGSWRGRNVFRNRLNLTEVRLFCLAITRTSTRNLFLRPARSASDAVISNPVVRLTRKTPVAYRWVERDCLAIKNEFPVRGPDRRYHLVPVSDALTQWRPESPITLGASTNCWELDRNRAIKASRPDLGIEPCDNL